MGWFGSDNSQKQADEFDLGHPLIYNDWTGNYVSRYDYIKKYIETRLGRLNIKDATLQSKMSSMVLENSKESFELWSSYAKDFVDVKTDGNNTLVQVQIPKLPKYKYQSEWELDSTIKGLRSSLRCIGFVWNRRHKTYLKRSSKMTFDEVVQAIGIDKSRGKNGGLDAYCSQVAYRQTLHGISDTWSRNPEDSARGDEKWFDDGAWATFLGLDEKQSDASIGDKCTECGEEIHLLRRKALPDVKTCVNCASLGDSKDKIDISTSESSKNSYSKVEQLEKLIALRNKGEISPEEFNNLKKELLS